MNNFTRGDIAEDNKSKLTIRFCVVALLATCLIVLAITVASYYQIRKQAIGDNLDEVASTINAHLFADIDAKALHGDPLILANYWQAISQLSNAKEGAFFDAQMRMLWTSTAQLGLTLKEKSKFQEILDDPNLAQIVDTQGPALINIRELFTDNDELIAGLMPIRDNLGQAIGMLKLVRKYDYILRGVKDTIRHLFWYVLGGSLLIFIGLSHNFLLGLKTIESQEKKLNRQIERLSSLLSINKSMQKSIKTATRRAVELNEKFLRRVGSDLHDGPAQSIGYAILRLDRVEKIAQEKYFNQDFHLVKEALTSALDELRDISSGLVLPELEQMTLTQSLQKVVKRHSINSNTQVVEHYRDLPDPIPLPIKICAYRFVQEGLNNAHRHGQSEKCRVDAYVEDDVLHLSLKDNGMGFRKSQLNAEGGHLGLMGLKDRIESLGGRFSINSELGVGTAIKATIALSDDV